MKKIRFKKITINWKNFFNYIFLVALSSGILLTFLIALPLTEKLTNIAAFDLNVAETIWSKEYILNINTEEQSDIKKTKNIIFKRLNDYGVEEVTITESDKQLKVIVKTTKDEAYVDELVKNPYVYKIVTRKEDVNFDDTENQYTMYFGENYDDTQFDSTSFRNIYVTKLANSSGDKSYFGIAKPWPNKTKTFKEFLKDNGNQYLGVDIDGFVTPVYISDPNVFAIPLTEDSNSLEVVDILYNSGSMPISYEFAEENILETLTLDINYVEVTIAIFVSIILIYLYLYFTKIYSIDMVLRSLFTTLFSLALLLSYLKITGNEIQLSILIITAVITIFLTNTLQQNKESRNLIAIILFLLGILFYTLGIGYLHILGNQLMMITVITFISVIIGNFYINKVLVYFKQ
jgi:hypothetical protein